MRASSIEVRAVDSTGIILDYRARTGESLFQLFDAQDMKVDGYLRELGTDPVAKNRTLNFKIADKGCARRVMAEDS